ARIPVRSTATPGREDASGLPRSITGDFPLPRSGVTGPACAPGRGHGTSGARASGGGPWPGTAAARQTSPRPPAGSAPPPAAAARWVRAPGPPLPRGVPAAGALGFVVRGVLAQHHLEARLPEEQLVNAGRAELEVTGRAACGELLPADQPGHHDRVGVQGA